MPTNTVEHWETIAQRMRAVPATAEGILESLRQAQVRPAKRQFAITAEQSADYAKEGGFWTTFAEGAAPAEGQLPDALRAELRSAADGARRAFAHLAEELRALEPTGQNSDAVGRERYQLLSRRSLGAVVDFEETYAWGQEELERIVDEQKRVAEQIGGPGTSVETDPSSEISVGSSVPSSHASLVLSQKRTLSQSPVHTGAWSAESRLYSDQSPEDLTAREPPPGEET